MAREEQGAHPLPVPSLTGEKLYYETRHPRGPGGIPGIDGGAGKCPRGDGEKGTRVREGLAEMAGLFLLGKVLKPCIHAGCRENIFVENMEKVLQKHNEGVIIKTWSRKNPDHGRR